MLNEGSKRNLDQYKDNLKQIKIIHKYGIAVLDYGWIQQYKNRLHGNNDIKNS